MKRQIKEITRKQPEQFVGTIANLDVISRDANGAVKALAPNITANIHGTSGLSNIEISTAINPLDLRLGDEVLITKVHDRFIVYATIPLSQRTGAPGYTEGYGSNDVGGAPQPTTLTAIISGKWLKLEWDAVPRALYYQVIRSKTQATGDANSEVIAETSNTSYDTRYRGEDADPNMWYSVVAITRNGQASSMSDWVQPDVSGSQESGFYSENLTSAISGELVIAKSSSAVRTTFTTFDSPTPFYVEINDGASGHATSQPIDNGDMLYMTNKNGHKVYVKVVSASDKGSYWQYKCKKIYPSKGTNRTVQANSAVINYGSSGNGYIYQTADNTNAPFISVRTHTGDTGSYPIQTSPLELVRMGNLNGNWGYVADTFGFAVGEYASNKPNITLDTTNGLRIRNYTTNVLTLDTSGNASFAGAISATSGTIGGFTIGSTTITSGSITLNSATPKITLGAATDYLTGTGIFMGLSGGAYKFRVGTTSKYFGFDGTNPVINGNWITGSSMETSLQTWTTNIVFSSASATQINWTSGTIRLNDGTTYSISSGNTGTMSALNYIYLDTAVSTTVLQKTTTYSTAVGSGKIILAAAQNNTTGASIIPFTGQQPILDGTAQIVASSITAGAIAATAIDSMTVTGATIRTASSGARTEMNASNLFGLGFGGVGGYNGTTAQWYAKASDGKLYAGGGKVVVDQYGITANNGTEYVFSLAAAAYTYDGESLSAGDVVIGDHTNTNIKIGSGNVSIRFATTDKTIINSNGMQLGGILSIVAETGTVSSGTIDLDVGAAGTFLTSRYRITSSSGAFTIRGIATPTVDGAILYLVNDTTNNMTLKNSGSPSAGYSEIRTFSSDVSTTGKGSAILVYDSSSDQWHLFAITG